MTDAQVFAQPPSESGTEGRTQELTDQDIFGGAPAPLGGQSAFPGPLGFLQQMDVSSTPGLAKTIASGLQGIVAQTVGNVANHIPVWDKIDAGEHVAKIDDVYDYALRSPEQRAELRASMQIPVTEQPLFKAAAAIPGTVPAGEDPRIPGYEKAFWAPAIGGALGSTGAGIGLGSVPFAGPILAGAIFTGAGVDEARERARKAGATPEQENRAAILGGASGATDMIDLGLPYMGSFGTALSLFKRIGVKAFETAFVEMGQEGV